MAFFDTSVLFWGHVLSSGRISANTKIVEKMRDWLTPTNAKVVHSFLELASYYQRSIPKFAQMANCLQELVGPTSKKAKTPKVKRKKRQLLYQTRLKKMFWMDARTQPGILCAERSLSDITSSGLLDIQTLIENSCWKLMLLYRD